MDGKTRVFWIPLLALLLLLAAATSWGCGKGRAPQRAEGEAEEEQGQGQEEGQEAAGRTMTLTLYFSEALPDRMLLAAEKRTVEDVSDPYRAAMEELIAGPSPGSGLGPVLPHTVKVLGAERAGGILTVNVSGEILTDAGEVGVGAAGEALALAAIANTLTEFDGVEKVKLLVEGVQEGVVGGRHVEDFWGHVGLPEYLERDEGVVDASRGEGS